jgi:serine/threonine protein kinase
MEYCNDAEFLEMKLEAKKQEFTDEEELKRFVK